MLSPEIARHLAQRLDPYSTSEHRPQPEPLPHGVDAHLLVSALQKAIRRSDLATARRAGHQLLAVAPPRLWRRLSVLALEDIGLGDATLAAEMVGVAASAKWRREAGGDARVLDALLARACFAVKDRSADHALSILKHDPPPPKRRAVLARLSCSGRLDLIADDHAAFGERLFAAAQAIGCLSDKPRSTGSRLSAVLEPLWNLGVPALLTDACALHSAKSRDGLAVALPLAWLAWRKDGRRIGTVKQVLHSQAVGELPDYAFDPLHTRVGRRAVELWLRSFLTRPPFTTAQAAMALWNGESAALRMRLTWPAGERLRVAAHTADLLSVGLPVERHEEIRDWLDANILALQPARVAAWKEALRAARHGKG